MDGGAEPIRDGDWVVLEWARSEGLPKVAGRVALVGQGDPHEGQSHYLKRVVREDGRVVLRSDNPARPDLPTDRSTTLLAMHRATVRPRTSRLPSARASPTTSSRRPLLSAAPTAPYGRVDGHLFVVLTEAPQLSRPTCAAVRVPSLRPAETAFVLARVGDVWRYCGVGRAGESGWSIPEVDFDTWRALGAGRSASRELSDTQLADARTFVERLSARLPPGTELTTPRGGSHRSTVGQRWRADSWRAGRVPRADGLPHRYGVGACRCAGAERGAAPMRPG